MFIFKYNKSKKRFTLIELLVVIAIIAILAAILFPALKKARDKSREVFCINNHKQIYLGMEMYYNDYPDWKGTLGSDDESKGGWWRLRYYNASLNLNYAPVGFGKLLMGGYIGKGEVLYCCDFRIGTTSPYQTFPEYFGDNKSASDFFTKLDEEQYHTMMYRYCGNTESYHHGAYQYNLRSLNRKYKKYIFCCITYKQLYTHGGRGVVATYHDGQTKFVKGGAKAGLGDPDHALIDAAFQK